MTNNGWEVSAPAWIADMGETGDFSRRHILDAPMLARATGFGACKALDLGCGEGRFCRMLRAAGLEATGIEPALPLLAEARRRDPEGRYLDARAEALPLEDASFDLAVSYLTLIDIDGLDAAVAEAARVLRPGGRFLIANLNSFSTAGGWSDLPDGRRALVMGDYFTTRAEWVEWRGIRIRNWHRPQSVYFQALIGAGLRLTHFEEPRPTGGSAQTVARYLQAPWFHVMEWRKG